MGEESITVRPAANPAVRLTPHGPFAGFQDVTNSAYVAGWVWNHETPDTPVSVAIYDGALWLATVTAQMYRRDLHHAGMGNGAHGFVYPLERHVHDHRAHHITVQIVGTDVTLRNAGTGGFPPTITRRDQPPAIPHYSLPPLCHWAYFTALRRILAHTPVPVWRPLAAILACVALAFARQPRVLNVALLRALGVRASPVTRWQTHWTRAYQRQADLILLAQGEHVTPQWAAGQVDMPGRLPPGGAILVSVHHYGSRLAGPVLAAHGYHVGGITTRPRDPRSAAQLDATLRAHWRFTEHTSRLSYGNRMFSREAAGRKGLRLLEDGGYLIIHADEFARQPPFAPLLGRSMTAPKGAVWFARRSGKPLVPFMIVPQGWRWRLWIGEAVIPATAEGLGAALESCIRQAPGSWQAITAMAWLAAPRWNPVTEAPVRVFR